MNIYPKFVSNLVEHDYYAILNSTVIKIHHTVNLLGNRDPFQLQKFICSAQQYLSNVTVMK
jgi:hypothetical protein